MIVEVGVSLNNYCTNCGKKLGKNDLVCKSCNTPIVDIPDNYQYKSPLRKKSRKIILVILGIVAFTISVSLTKEIITRVQAYKFLKKYVNPYLEKTYKNEKYKVKYDSMGKCIISGNCHYDPLGGCDGGLCKEYEYLSKYECKAYYFKVEMSDKKLLLTLVDKNDETYVVEGENIYGENKDGNIDE